MSIVAVAIAVGACAQGPAGSAPAAPLGAGGAAAPSCAPAEPYRPRTVADRVPTLVQAQLTPTGDGGIVIAFASYRGSREYPGSRFTVLGVDASTCVRWRRSLRGGWPIAQPVKVGSDAILVATQPSLSGPAGRSPPALRLYTLSVATGRVLRRERLPALSSDTSSELAVVSDRRGDVAALLSEPVGLGTPDCCTDLTVKLSRAADATHWQRQVIARSGIGLAAVAARPDGAMVLGYPRRGRYWVRTGTVAGSLSAPVAAGRLGDNFRGGSVALAQDGTLAAAWQAGTYSRPWRLRAAVRPAVARRFAGPAQLGFAGADHGTLFEGPPPALRIASDGSVTVAFSAPLKTTAGDPLAMCARSTPAGRFAPAQRFTEQRSGDPGRPATMVLGRSVSAAMLMVVPDPDALGRTLVVVGSGCRASSTHLLEAAAGHPVMAAVGDGDRIWLLTQSQPSVDSRRPLMLTVTEPAG
jgi:hypothetical protein